MAIILKLKRRPAPPDPLVDDEGDQQLAKRAKDRASAEESLDKMVETLAREAARVDHAKSTGQ